MSTIKKVVRNEVEYLNFGMSYVYHRHGTFQENHLNTLDIVELMMIIEDMFDIEITAAEEEALTTPRGLEKLIKTKVKDADYGTTL